MERKTVAKINEYSGTTVNPLNTPDTLFELYSVPSFDSQYPEIVCGKEIGSAKATVEENDVLICKINPRINRVWVVAHHTQYPLIASSEWIVVRNRSMNPDYLKWYFSCPAFRRLFESQTAGIGGSLIRAQPKQVAKYPVPVPDIAVQKSIANRLNKVTNLISLRKQQLAKLDELVKARFVEMFGDIETNRMGWKKEPLQSHINMITGYPFDSSAYVEKGIRICGGLIILPDRIKWDECKYWSSIDGYEQFLLANNDIVVALDRPWITDGFKIGTITEADLPALLIQRTARIRGIDMVQSFVLYLLKSKSFERHCTVTGSLVPHISNKDINSYQVIVPPIELQNKFAAFVAQVEKSKSKIQKSLEKLETLKKALMQKYFG